MSRPLGDDGYSLVEVTVTGLILAVVLAIVGNYLFSAGNTVARSAARQDDNAAAATALGLIESNVRFACNMSISNSTLYVENSCGDPQQSCTEWSSGGGKLIEKMPGGQAAVANGVTGLTFTTNGSYNGLVTIQFNLRQPQDQSGDAGGVTSTETLTARNMSGAVGVGSVVCT